MEIKEMTQQEIFAYLNDTKILCTSREESKKVQEKLFALGFSYYGEKSKEVVDSAFTLYINIHNKMQFGSDLSMWVDDEARRIEPSEILAIQIKEEKPKFDPKTLQPFDRVLVRDIAGKTWLCTLFSHIENEDFICTSSVWKCCIPYNEDIKHLVGTADEAPEFYRIKKIINMENILSQEAIQQELRVKEVTALVYKDGLEAVTKEVKEVIEKWLTPIVKCKEVIATQEDRGYNILLIFEDYSAKISLYELTILEAQNLTKEYLVKNYGIRTTL